MKSNYNGLSIYEYNELREIQSSYEGIELIIEVVAFILDVDPITLDDYSIRDLHKIYEANQWVNELPVSINSFNYSGLSIGKFIDLNKIVNEQADRNLIDVLDIMEVEYDLHQTPVMNVYHYISSFIKYRQLIMKSYPTYFIGEGGDEQEDIDLDSIENVRDRMMAEQQMKRDKIKNEMQWHALIYELCDYDITKVELVVEKPVEMVFNMLVTKKLYRDD